MRCLWQACLADRQSQGLFYRSFYRVPILGAGRRNIVKGYVAHKGDRWYAVIYEGLDPVTGREIRRWHAAGARTRHRQRNWHAASLARSTAPPTAAG
jgi:hypothetical protein